MTKSESLGGWDEHVRTSAVESPTEESLAGPDRVVSRLLVGLMAARATAPRMPGNAKRDTRVSKVARARALPTDGFLFQLSHQAEPNIGRCRRNCHEARHRDRGNHEARGHRDSLRISGQSYHRACRRRRHPAGDGPAG